MFQDVNSVQKPNRPNAPQYDGVTSSPRTPAYIGLDGGVAAKEGCQDGYQPKGSAATQTNQKLTPQQVYDNFEQFCLKNKININIQEAQKSKMLEKISGKSSKELASVSNEEFNKLLNTYFLRAVQKFQTKDGQVDIAKVTEQAKDWRIAVELGGWSIDGYEAKQTAAKNKYGKPEGIVERIKRFYNVDITNIQGKTPEEAEKIKKNLLVGYVRWMVGQVPKDMDPAKYIKQEFTRLIANTEDDSVRHWFFDLIKTMNQNHEFSKVKDRTSVVMNALLATIESYESDEKRAEAILDANIPEMASDLDAESFEKVNTAAAKSMTTAENAKKYNEQAQAVNDKILADIDPKVLESIKAKQEEQKLTGKEPEYTEEELAVLEKLAKSTSLQGGTWHGFNVNDHLAEEEKTELAIDINNYNRDKVNYREILEKTYELAKETKGIDTEKYAKLMDEATNGNYSIVVKDKEEGTVTDLNPIVSVENNASVVKTSTVVDNKSPQSNNGLGYYQSSDYTIPTTLEEINKKIQSYAEKDEPIKISSVKDIKTTDDLKTYRKENSSYTFLKTFLKEGLGNLSAPVVKCVEETFKGMHISQKISVLKQANLQDLSTLLNVTSYNDLLKIKTPLLSFKATQKLEEKQEEAREQQEKLNA
ncbi:MAG: hypothetical protein E7Z89_04210 [Cyanobacteria bacterium SIG28]|nr:hypothetical protein [Cyanobacteria bacterium SIG28]